MFHLLLPLVLVLLAIGFMSTSSTIHVHSYYTYVINLLSLNWQSSFLQSFLLEQGLLPWQCVLQLIPFRMHLHLRVVHPRVQRQEFAMKWFHADCEDAASRSEIFSSLSQPSTAKESWPVYSSNSLAGYTLLITPCSHLLLNYQKSSNT